MKKPVLVTAVVALVIIGYACKNDDENPITVVSPVQLTATLIAQPTSTTLTPSTATGSFLGSLSTSSSSSVLSYTVNYSGITPTAITLDPVLTSTSVTTGTTNYGNSILLAGVFPSTTTNPGSGTSTSPGSGTSTSPGSGTETSPGSGTSTSPGSGTETSPGSGTSTSPGSGTSTNPGSGTITTPLSGTVSISQTRADSLSRSLYQLNIRSANYPNGEIRGTVQVR